MTLGNFSDFALGIAGINAFGREGQMKILPGAETGMFFQDLAQFGVGGAGIGGGFEDNQCAGLQVRRNRPGGIQDISQIRSVIFLQRSRHADDDGGTFGDTAKISGGGEAFAFDGSGNLFGGDVQNVTLPGIKLFHFFAINIEAQDAAVRPGELQRKWQADVAKPDDPDLQWFAHQCMAASWAFALPVGEIFSHSSRTQ